MALDSLVASEQPRRTVPGACSSPHHLNPTDPPANRSANAASRSALAALHKAGGAFRARVANLGARFAPACSTSTPARLLLSSADGHHSSPVPRATVNKTKGPGAIPSSPRTACTCCPRCRSGIKVGIAGGPSRVKGHQRRGNQPVSQWLGLVGPATRRPRNSECRSSGESNRWEAGSLVTADENGDHVQRAPGSNS